MPHAIWKGYISFGLVNIPVVIHSAEKQRTLNFHLLDSRDLGRIRYERINEGTGKEVPWDAIVKGYEYEPGNYVLLSEKEINSAKHENLKTIEIEEFISDKELESIYFEKPYYILPNKRGEKGYVLLRETLKQTHKLGIAKVMIRTREHLAAIIPRDESLLIQVLRYPQEIKKVSEYEFPEGDIKSYKISAKEVEIAKQLIDAMTVKWKPEHYHDEFQDVMMKMIDKKITQGPKKSTKKTTKGSSKAQSSSRNVIDFMDVLKESIKERKKRTAMRRTKPSTDKKTSTRRTKSASKKSARK